MHESGAEYASDLESMCLITAGKQALINIQLTDYSSFYNRIHESPSICNSWTKTHQNLLLNLNGKGFKRRKGGKQEQGGML